jgi:hypothetical protein
LDLDFLHRKSVGGGFSITGASILLLYPPLAVVLGCFFVMSLFCMSFRSLNGLVLPLIGVAPVNVHEFYEHSSVSGKLQEHQEDDEQCVGDNCPRFCPRRALYVLSGTFSPFQELRREP